MKIRLSQFYYLINHDSVFYKLDLGDIEVNVIISRIILNEGKS